MRITDSLPLSVPDPAGAFGNARQKHKTNCGYPEHGYPEHCPIQQRQEPGVMEMRSFTLQRIDHVVLRVKD
ncbi:hypothetical protein, partial [Actinoplanes ianthinogenes]|uniref:hypothetical protein n=1 Tax=Actinoplanes ianthinogenes TaxID=122358 RepID=UPI001E4DE84B